MRLPLRLVLLVMATLLVTACGGGGPSPDPIPDPSAAWLRAQTFQALPPANVFAVGPTAVITGDGGYVTAGAMAEIYPGPLLPPLVERDISDAGRDAILAEAERLGLLGATTDFTGAAAVPGGITGQLGLTVDGNPVMLTGDPNAQIQCLVPPCDPGPGTPEAFGELWRRLADPAPWLGAELGPEASFVADAYAVLVGPAPDPDPGLGAQLQEWPLNQPIATFGGPVANGTLRCGIVAGDDAATLRPALEAANQLTQWVEDETTSATFGLTVRPIIADENPCADVFGTG
jgi:hypothetical protein